MKVTIKNYHLLGVINLCNELYPQRMLIGDKLHIKETAEKFAKKHQTVEELRVEIVLSNGGNKEVGITPDFENYNKAVAEINELFNLETEISFTPISLEVLKKFEVSETIDIVSIEILSGVFNLHGVKESQEIAE